MSAEQIAELLPDEVSRDGVFAVWPENRKAVETFIAIATQWRWDGMTGVFFGFDYPGMEAALRMLGVKNHRRMFEDLRAMERAALEVLNKEKES